MNNRTRTAVLAATLATYTLWYEHGLGDDDTKSEPVFLALVACLRSACIQLSPAEWSEVWVAAEHLLGSRPRSPVD